MFFPLFISKSKTTRRVISGEHYTAEWWMRKSGFDSVHKVAARLNILARKEIVEKVSVGECEIVRFMPTASYCENGIVAMLQNIPLDKLHSL